MESPYTLWIPVHFDELHHDIQNITQLARNKYNSPNFDFHITIIGVPNLLNYEGICQIGKTLSEESQTFKAKISNISKEDSYYKKLYLTFDDSSRIEFQKLHDSAISLLRLYDTTTIVAKYEPHISLVYSNLNHSEVPNIKETFSHILSQGPSIKIKEFQVVQTDLKENPENWKVLNTYGIHT